ncbi:amino acid permease [Limisphaera ngatamarikiensis]|uniref:Amino acid permease n=1 Tax=Limisphaera ngatamarikiensis TaxID=1324935 RepID=A0A6M1RD64_9BACT|nr:amino acid permease [Limisphaera ngatamarikiensis]NGO38038.1 amino acid permease [Limisphaera ngatamarikiensis]
MSGWRWNRCKPIEALGGEGIPGHLRLRRALGARELVFLGVGAIVGAGIFSTAGTAAAGGEHHLGAGPGLVLSFLLVAGACALAGLCYAELAALVPVSGSAYTYAYATLGELVAWIIGWDLILEYAIGNVAVAISWSDYFQTLVAGLGWEWPVWLGTDYRSAWAAAREMSAWLAQGGEVGALAPAVVEKARAWLEAPRLWGVPLVLNVPAAAIVGLITWVLVRGIRESAAFNTAMVLVKLAVIGLFVGVGAFYVDPGNWRPFLPNGWAGVGHAAAIVFFAYIGFDAVSTAAEETRDPQRNLPRGILGSLLVCAVLYAVVALVLTGMVRWDRLRNVADPLAMAFVERGLDWLSGWIALGAVVATASVLLVFQLGQPRILFAMARDGLLPAWAARVHPRFRTPHVTTVWTGVVVGSVAAVTHIEEMVELCNIGTLFAFVVVAAGVLVLRWREPDRPRPFRVPWVPWVPLGAMATCGWLMWQLPARTWWRFGLWLVAGLMFYGARVWWLGRRPVDGSQAGCGGVDGDRVN